RDLVAASVGHRPDSRTLGFRGRSHLKAELRLLTDLAQLEGARRWIHFPTMRHFEPHLAGRFCDVGPGLHGDALRFSVRKDEYGIAGIDGYRRSYRDRTHQLAPAGIDIAIVQRTAQRDLLRAGPDLEARCVVGHVIRTVAPVLAIDRVGVAGLG